MWSHQAKAVTWVYVVCSGSVQSASSVHQQIAQFCNKHIHPSDSFCLVAPQMFFDTRHRKKPSTECMEVSQRLAAKLK